MLDGATAIAVSGSVAGCPGSCEAAVGGAASLEANGGCTVAGRCCVGEVACSAGANPATPPDLVCRRIADRPVQEQPRLIAAHLTRLRALR